MRTGRRQPVRPTSSPSGQSSRWFAALLSVCWTNAASSFSASRWARAPRGASGPMSSSSDHFQPESVLVSMGRPGSFRSIAAGSNSTTLPAISRLWPGSSGQP